MKPIVLSLVILFAVGACSNAAVPSPPSKANEGQTCVVDTDCDDGLGCRRVDGKGTCTQTCNSAYAPIFGYSSNKEKIEESACYEGFYVSCSLLPKDSSCGCGCGGGKFCQANPDQTSFQCVPTANVGAACSWHWGCTSGNCSAGESHGNETGTCYVAIGAACTKNNCQNCYGLGTPGTTSCTRTCNTNDAGDCPSGSTCINGGYCAVNCELGTACSDGAACHPLTDSTSGVCSE